MTDRFSRVISSSRIMHRISENFGENERKTKKRQFIMNKPENNEAGIILWQKFEPRQWSMEIYLAK